MELQSIQIMFATYYDTVITKGVHFSLYDATNDNLLYEEDILRERMADNQYVVISLENINTPENRFYFVLRGLDENDGNAFPAAIWTTDSDELSKSLEINGEENGKVICTIYTYQWEDKTGSFTFAAFLVLEVLAVMLSLFITIPKIKKRSIRVIASVICFVANAALAVWIGIWLAELGTGTGFSVWVATALLIMIIAMVVYAICGRISFALIFTDVLYFMFVFADYMVMKYRGIPIGPTDLFLLGTVNTVIGHYEISLAPKQAELLFGMLIPIILLIRMDMSAWFIALSHRIRNKKKLVVSFVVGALGVFGVALFASPKVLGYFHVDMSLRWRPSLGYHANGPLMNFMADIKDSYRKKPSGYTAEKAEAILEQYSGEAEKGDEKNPNIIMIMNESLTDFSELGGEITPDPLGFIHGLQENTIRGNCYVSNVSGGTANSEFMALTGHTVAFMPQGSVVYSVFPRDNITGMASELKKRGYSCTAIHPCPAENYNRHIIYPSMGFDNFLSWSSFGGAETVRGWVSDKATYDKIIALYEEKGEEPLFVFDVTIQGHGGYANHTEWDTKVVAAEGNDELTEYLSSTYVSDKAFQELVKYFAKVEEPTVILMFGDHWPSVGTGYYEKIFGKSTEEMNLEETQIEYMTPYVLWTNYDIEEKEMDVAPNQFSGLVKRAAGISLSRYELFIEEFSKEIPIINANGYQDKTGVWHTFDEDNEYSNLILQYQYLEYYLY
ncbi:MAG: LTA synthase family protein [Lachnospiraceae bacterium]|nr:LTA synthase family protein [Lachnospiraceae bacterium]